MADQMEGLGVTFRADKLVCIDIPAGKGCGAKQAGCSDHTKIMLLEPSDLGGDRDANLKKLKEQLSDALDNMGI